MLPFLFSAWLMTSVAHAADAMLDECYRQFPLIVNEGAEPDYDTCRTKNSRIVQFFLTVSLHVNLVLVVVMLMLVVPL